MQEIFRKLSIIKPVHFVHHFHACILYDHLHLRSIFQDHGYLPFAHYQCDLGLVRPTPKKFENTTMPGNLNLCLKIQALCSKYGRYLF